MNQQRQFKAVVRASDIMLLADLEAYVKVPGKFPVSKINFSYLQLPCKNMSFIQRPLKEMIEDPQEKMEEAEAKEEKCYEKRCLKSYPTSFWHKRDKKF